MSDFISACAIMTDKMLISRSEIVLLGDMNIDILHIIHDNNLHTESNPLVDFCDRYCLTNTIKEPTRVTKSSKTLIDVILVNRPERCATSGTLHLGMSDHDLVYIIRKQRLPSSTVKAIETNRFRDSFIVSHCR